MPFCPMCKIEYREGFTTCSDCDVDLVPELPAEEPEPEAPVYEAVNPDDSLVEVFAAENGMEAEIVLGVLQSAGIRGYLSPDMSQYIIRLGTIVDRLQQQTIYVLESNAGEARAIIEEAMSAGSEDSADSDQ